MKIIFPLLFILILFIPSAYSTTPAEEPDQRLRTFVNLLDYIGKDYPNAVEQGKIINDFEYREMVDFGQQIADLHRQLRDGINQPQFTNLNTNIANLQRTIQAKAPADTVQKWTNSIKDQVLALGLIKVSPQQWPDLSKGRNIYQTHCQSCHGAKGFGDGPLASELSPPPTSFRDSVNADNLSPLQAYNTIRLGLEGTAMRAFSELSNQEAWEVAFYINSLNYNTPVSDSVKKQVKTTLADTVSLKTVSLFTNKKWKKLMLEQNINPKTGMAVIRHLAQDPSGTSHQNSLPTALALLEKSQQSYANKAFTEARRYALDAYLDGVEPVESQINAIDPELTKEIESKMLGLRSAIKNRVDEETFATNIEAATLTIQQAQQLLNNQQYTFWLNFMLAASILLREGLEAFLIIMIILSVLRSVDAGHAAKYIHGGWIIALIAGGGGWLIVQSFIQMSSLQRELMEGIGAMVAVAMLLYIGYWMHSKTHTSQWTQFIKEHIHKLVETENLWGLALLSFIVVFREAFESIIFLSSIGLKSAGGGNTGIYAALVTVAFIITGIGYIYKKFTKNIPVRQLFRYSSFMLAVLALILIGKGVRSLQEAGYIEIANLPIDWWSFPLLGIYATWPTVIAQLIIGFVIAVLWYYSRRMSVAREG